MSAGVAGFVGRLGASIGRMAPDNGRCVGIAGWRGNGCTTGRAVGGAANSDGVTGSGLGAAGTSVCGDIVVAATGGCGLCADSVSRGLPAGVAAAGAGAGTGTGTGGATGCGATAAGGVAGWGAAAVDALTAAGGALVAAAGCSGAATGVGDLCSGAANSGAVEGAAIGVGAAGDTTAATFARGVCRAWSCACCCAAAPAGDA